MEERDFEGGLFLRVRGLEEIYIIGGQQGKHFLSPLLPLHPGSKKGGETTTKNESLLYKSFAGER